MNWSRHVANQPGTFLGMSTIVFLQIPVDHRVGLILAGTHELSHSKMQSKLKIHRSLGLLGRDQFRSHDMRLDLHLNILT